MGGCHGDTGGLSTLFSLSSVTMVKLSLLSLCFESYSATPRWLPLHTPPLFSPFCLQMLIERAFILAWVMKEDRIFACTDPSCCCVDRCCEAGKHGLQLESDPQNTKGRDSDKAVWHTGSMKGAGNVRSDYYSRWQGFDVL